MPQPSLADLYTTQQPPQGNAMGSGMPQPQTQGGAQPPQGAMPDTLEPQQIENLETLLGVEIPQELWPTIMRIIKNKKFKLPPQEGQSQGFDDTMDGSDEDQSPPPSDGSGDMGGDSSFIDFGQPNQ